MSELSGVRLNGILLYVGQTSRSLYERIKEEVRGWRNRDEKNALWCHSVLYHSGGDFPIDVKVVDRSFGRPTKRMIAEAVGIDCLGEDETMNSKREWTYTKLNKVQVT